MTFSNRPLSTSYAKTRHFFTWRQAWKNRIIASGWIGFRGRFKSIYGLKTSNSITFSRTYLLCTQPPSVKCTQPPSVERFIDKSQWPPRSFDLSHCDFYLWVYSKDTVYGYVRLPKSIAELKANIERVKRWFKSSIWQFSKTDGISFENIWFEFDKIKSHIFFSL